MFKRIFFASFVFLFATINASSILDAFKNQGYYEMANEALGEKDFEKIYSQLDLLNQFIDHHSEWANALYAADQEYVQSEINDLYGTPPIGYIDESKSEKTKKTYFHFTQDYFDFIGSHYPHLIADSKEFESFMESLKEVTKIGAQKFEEAISLIKPSIDLSGVLHSENGSLLILTKVVRYEPTEFAASNPHFDFSGLSFLFDNTDDEGSESLLIAPYREDLMLEDFNRPGRKVRKDASKSSLLLLPGLALQHLNVPIAPTPHAVLNQSKKRYALILFAMTPNTKLSYDEIKLRKIKLSGFKP